MNIEVNGTYIYDTKTRRVQNYDLVIHSTGTNYAISDVVIRATVGTEGENGHDSQVYISKYNMLHNTSTYSGKPSIKSVANILFAVSKKAAIFRPGYTVVAEVTNLANMFPEPLAYDDDGLSFGNLYGQLKRSSDFIVEEVDNQYFIRPKLVCEIASQFKRDAILSDVGNYLGLKFDLEPYVQRQTTNERMRKILSLEKTEDKRAALKKCFSETDNRNNSCKYIIFSVQFNVDYSVGGDKRKIEQSYYRLYR